MDCNENLQETDKRHRQHIRKNYLHKRESIYEATYWKLFLVKRYSEIKEIYEVENFATSKKLTLMRRVSRRPRELGKHESDDGYERS